MHAIPAGFDEIAPLPVPLIETLSPNVTTTGTKFADTLRAAVIWTVHVAVPVHAPLQPVNVKPPAGVAVSVTDVPWT